MSIRSSKPFDSRILLGVGTLEGGYAVADGYLVTAKQDDEFANVGDVARVVGSGGCVVSSGSSSSGSSSVERVTKLGASNFSSSSSGGYRVAETGVSSGRFGSSGSERVAELGVGSSGSGSSIFNIVAKRMDLVMQLGGGSGDLVANRSVSSSGRRHQ